MELFPTQAYERAIRKLVPAEVRQAMETAIIRAPDAAPVIPGAGGIRKLRWAVPGRGKRGGIRTIYFHCAGPEEIHLLAVYSKSDREDLTPADRKAAIRLVEHVKKRDAFIRSRIDNGRLTRADKKTAVRLVKNVKKGRTET